MVVLDTAAAAKLPVIKPTFEYNKFKEQNIIINKRSLPLERALPALNPYHP
jgi:hypothetical protein